MTEADEYRYMHQHESEGKQKGEGKLATRLMYCDLLEE